MTNGKDPFEFEEEGDKTVIRKPDPAGRRAAEAAGKPPPADPEKTAILGGAAASQPARRTLEAAVSAPMPAGPGITETDGTNPLIAAGARLLALAGVLREAASHNDVPGLRAQIVQELSAYERSAQAKGAGQTEVQLGHYILCALLDDVVMATPWGGRQGWSERSLTATYHNQVDSGDKLYELIARLERAPGQHPSVLELAYVALSMGFEGRLRLDQRGAAQHMKVRESLFRLIREQRGDPERALSPHWRGVEAGYRPLARRMPVWVYWAGCAAVALLVFSGFRYALDRRTETVLAPLGTITLAVAEPAGATFEQPAAPDDAFDQIKNILQPDIDAGRVLVRNRPNAVDIRVVSLASSELFGSGQATISGAYRDTVSRIAQASQLTKGAVFVRGYSDAQPIRTQKYASNWELSLARAEAMRRTLADTAGQPERFSAEGLGPEDPIADNATSDGRRLNRRVEIMLQKSVGAN